MSPRRSRCPRPTPILVDKYLSHAIEVDVDIVSDGEDVFIGGILDHIEEAGVHSGDATMISALPETPHPPEVLDNDRRRYRPRSRGD